MRHFYIRHLSVKTRASRNKSSFHFLKIQNYLTIFDHNYDSNLPKTHPQL